MKKLMVIAGGEWQVPIIRKSKDMGLNVLNVNPHQDSPGFKYADEIAIADVLDFEKNFKIAQKYKPDAIITDQSDIAVPTVAKLCDLLNLTGITEEKANLFTNKYLMRVFCKENNFPTPKFFLCETIDEILKNTVNLGYPFVLKPINNQSSRGVNIIYNDSELAIKFNDTKAHSNGLPILMEEFIDGKEFTVEGYKFSDTHVSLAISEKEYFKENISIAQRLTYKNENDYFDYAELKKINNLIVNKMGLPFGITHAEYKFYKGQFYLIEIGARGGGTKISSHIVPEVSGVDVNELLIKSALGEKIESKTISNRTSRSSVVVLEFLEFPKGLVKSIEGNLDVFKLPEVVDFKLNFDVGDVIKSPKDDRSRNGYVIIKVKDFVEYSKISREIKALVKVIYETETREI